MLHGVFKRLERHSTFSRAKEVLSRVMNESVNQFKFDSTYFKFNKPSTVFTPSTMLSDLFKRTDIGPTKC